MENVEEETVSEAVLKMQKWELFSRQGGRCGSRNVVR